MQTASGNQAYPSNIGSSNVTVGIEDNSDAAVGTAETVYWYAFADRVF